MALYGGNGGKVLFTAGDTDLDATSWTLNTVVDLIDVTELGATWRTFVAGLKDWTATVEAVMPSVTDPMTQLGVTGVLKLYIDTDSYFTGTGICTGVTPVNSTDDGARMTFTFEGDLRTAGITFT